MLYWAMIFFVVSLVSGIFGFGGIAETSAGVAQVFFYVFLGFFVLTMIFGLAGVGSKKRLG